MKKMTNKIVSLLLVATMAFSLTACNSATGNGNETQTTTSNTETTASTETTTTTTATADEDIVKPESIKVMWDGTIFKEGDNYAEEFYAALSETLGINVEFVRPDHSGYADQIAIAFADQSTLADVVILPSTYYASFASMGVLWDMTDAWLNSDTYNSGRLISVADKIIESWYVAGPDGEKRIYGMYPARGNGCVSYVKASWAKAAGYESEEDLPTTWAEYQEFLLAMKEVAGKSVISSAGLIQTEAPYTNYLPEFYQDAYPDFYYDEATGLWVDGFTEDAMVAALERLNWGYASGVLDPDIAALTKTSEARDKFYGDESGIFTYWAGTWAYTLKNNLEKNDLDSELWVMQPIEEMGAYYERLSPMIAITTACENPEGVFKYFIDTMLDGGEVQMLWQYGVEGVHYEYDADGNFQGLASQATKGSEKETITKKNLFEAQLKLAEFDTAVYPDGDPGYASTVTDEALSSFQIFDTTSKIAPIINMSDEYNDYSADLWTAKKEVIANVTLNEWTVEQGIQYYQDTCGEAVEEILASFNSAN